MAKFSVKAASLTCATFFLVTHLSLVWAAPLSPESPGSTAKLVFWFQHDGKDTNILKILKNVSTTKSNFLLLSLPGNHQHEYSSQSDIACDPLPESLSRNWNSLTVFLQGSTNTEERCAVLFQHGNCVNPVLALDLSTPKSSLVKEVKSFRYCHSSCDKCQGAEVRMSTSTSPPDYEDINK